MENKYSILIPCFNEEATVFEVVNSICNSFTDTLVLVINDGSTDNSNQFYCDQPASKCVDSLKSFLIS